jgi:uncharacterized protein (DUF1810 family)
MGSPPRAACTLDQVGGGSGAQRVGNHGARRRAARSRAELTSASKGDAMAEDDPFELSRFVVAQEFVFNTVLAELVAGRKKSHWMWFVFPQLRALGRSPTANFYGIAAIEEARAYLRHPVLANRLARAVDAVLGVAGRSAHEIFGSPDDLKFRSSMTLFDKAAGEEGERFRLALERFFAGEPDPLTLELLGGGID